MVRPQTILKSVCRLLGWLVSTQISKHAIFVRTTLLDSLLIMHCSHASLVEQAGAELSQAQVKLEVIVEPESYLELTLKLATTILCDCVD